VCFDITDVLDKINKMYEFEQADALNNFKLSEPEWLESGHLKIDFKPQSALRLHKGHQEKNLVIFVVFTLCTSW